MNGEVGRVVSKARSEATASANQAVSGLDAFAEELDEGETLLWSGRPDVRAVLKSRSGGWIAVAVFWIMFGAIAFAAYLVHTLDQPRKTEPESLAVLIGLILLVPASITLVAVLGYLRLRDCARETTYFITDRRAVILIPHKTGRIVRAFYRPALAALRRVDCENGFGDITFEAIPPSPQARSARFELGFYGIQNPAMVERILRGIGSPTS